MVRLKNQRELALIYQSGQITGKFLREVEQHIRPGVLASEIDAFAADFIAKHNAQPAFLGYNGFPGNICISFNEEVVHGIPSRRVIAEQDVVSVDVGVKYQGFFSDAARTFYMGTPGADVQRLLGATEESLRAGIGAVEDGQPVRVVSRAIEQVLLKARLGIIRELTGHGTGFALHEEPTVYNYDPGSRKPVVQNGLVLAIEPMASLGSSNILLGADNWTYRTADGSLAAHFEHTVVCWDGRAFVLTDPGDQEARQVFGRAA